MPTKKQTGKKSSAKTKDKPTTGTPKKSANKKTFPIVGIGASAGGLEALKAFFSNVPGNSQMAYLVVVHMTPTQPSMMPELLQKISSIPVSAAKDGQDIAPNHVYVIPPNKEIAVFKNKIQLLDFVKKGATFSIDLLLKSLAQDHGSSAAGVILSGTGTDGTLGIKEIKANDGLVLVQTEKSAAYDGMPRSAINTGVVDMVLPPEEMPEKLIQYFAHTNSATAKKATITATTGGEQQKWLTKIFAILRTQIGHDFSVYKANTILRRISRRMGLNHIDSHKTYVRFLRENPDEVNALFREMLIGVTSFFRDSESFEVLKTQIIPDLFKQMDSDSIFRAWIPGCSTGEEVYSLAIILRECLEKTSKQINLQLFGTDIDSNAIAKAREGIFPASIIADVSDARLKRFFIKEGDFYRIRKEIRDCAVFSVQDIIKDPPFSRLNLLCCRNLLIYLDTGAQRKILPLFHYTLKPEGILVLGSSETIGGFSNLFETLDKKWKIFKRQEVPQAMRQIVNFPSGPSTVETGYEPIKAIPPAKRSDITQLTQKVILDQYAPTTILIDAKGSILHVQGRTGKYLETPSGPPTNNILDLAREGLRIELSSALRTARSTAGEVIRKRISIKTNGDMQMIDLHVSPLKAPKELAGRFLVVFNNIESDFYAKDSKHRPADEAKTESTRIAELEKELQITRESHQTTIEELESSNEELKSTNEEMQSSNEELQSLNEELQTVNSELQNKVEELSAVHDDMRNLLNSTEIATIFVDNDMRIRRFTPTATAIVNLIRTDIGRPLKHVVSNLEYAGMMSDLKDVLKSLIPKETEVRTSKGMWYNMRILPYRTTDNRIAGAVLTFATILDQKQAQKTLEGTVESTREDQALVSALFDMNPNPMAVLDKNGKVVIANTGFSKIMNLSQEDLNGMDIFKIKNFDLIKTALKSKLNAALKDNKDFSTEAFSLGSGKRSKKYVIQAKTIKTEKNLTYRILLLILEVG